MVPSLQLRGTLLNGDASISYSPPEAFGRFRVLHQAGAGVLGPVFRGQDPERDRVVAIKAFRLDITPEHAAELAAELEKLAGRPLTHPCLVKLIAAGAEGSVAFLVQDYIAADTLDAALRQYGPAPIAQALGLLTQLAGALDFAAAVGVRHGNLHPRDILVAVGDCRLTGVGVTEALEHTRIRVAPRRPYAAPERLAGSPPSRQADVFALAVIAHELFTGRRPVSVGTRLSGRLQTLPAYRPAVDDVFAQALAPIAEDRFPTALDFVTALHDALGAVGGQARVADLPNVADVADEAIEAAPAATEDVPVVAADMSPPRPEFEAEVLDLPLEPVEPLGTKRTPIEPDLLDPVARDLAALDTPATPPPVTFEREAEAGAERPPVVGQIPEAGQPPEIVPPISGESAAANRPFRRRRPAITSSDLSLLDQAVQTENEPAVEPAHGHLSISPGSLTTTADRERPSQHRRPGLALLLMLLVGLFVGFIGGYTTGSRGWLASGATPPVPQRTEPLPSPASAGQLPATTPTPGAPADPAGRRGGVAGAPEALAGRPIAKGGRAAAAATAGPPDAGAAAPAGPFIGRLQVRSTPPGATVVLNGTERGATPLILRNLGLGHYSVQVSHAGYATEQRQLSLTRAKSAFALNLRLKRVKSAGQAAPAQPEMIGSLVVDSLPAGARVFLDGKLTGTTPLVLASVAGGSHAVRLELTGYRPWSTSVQVAAGERSKVTGSLELEGPQ